MRVVQPIKVGKQKKPSKGLKSTEELANPAVECLNFVMGGIKAADSVLTVSPGYAKEVAETEDKGCELEKIIKAKGITGILNGVEDIVKPDNEELGLDVKYNSSSLEAKLTIKAAMQKANGFQVSKETPLFVFMGRLDAQKGVDLLFEAVDKVLKEGIQAQFVFMGSGIEELEEVAAELEAKYPANFKAVLSFKGTEKYKTYAASDFALMPSRYEPCGLVQMEGMRFGCLPIVAPTGGLADTVKDMKTGLVMAKELDMDDIVPADVEMIAKDIKRAVALYGDKATLKAMQVSAMEAAKDFSWVKATKQYVQHFMALGAKAK
jgi:granule-bound starch synthase